MIQLDGSEVARWASKASEADLAALAGAEYSDDDDVWIVCGAGPTGISISKEGQEYSVRRPFNFFFSGTFFLEEAPGHSVDALIKGSLSVGERKISAANEHLRGLGFSVSELGGDTVALFLWDIVKAFEERQVAPDDGQWNRLHDILRNGSASVMRVGAKLVTQWIAHSEEANGGIFDVYRRVLLAFLYRHTGQLEKALQVSSIVEFPQSRMMGGSSSVAVLCTTRAAAMMDMAELQPSKRSELLKNARLTLNKANAISGSDSDEIRETYSRMKKLDQQNESALQKEREGNQIREAGRLP
ncbi:MAG: hypothetical protein NTV11_00795 [Rhodocyclales bacterium]|nr:hypothetical protein [Rhodocyclales bacterium]